MEGQCLRMGICYRHKTLERKLGVSNSDGSSVFQGSDSKYLQIARNR